MAAGGQRPSPPQGFITLCLGVISDPWEGGGESAMKSLASGMSKA